MSRWSSRGYSKCLRSIGYLIPVATEWFFNFVMASEAIAFRGFLAVRRETPGWRSLLVSYLICWHCCLTREAWYHEAVLNALCHRQYERYNLTIGIAIYDGRIEIENPGILPPQIMPEDIHNPHISYPYNPLIANVLYSTTYIENRGSGVKRIMGAC